MYVILEVCCPYSSHEKNETFFFWFWFTLQEMSASEQARIESVWFIFHHYAAVTWDSHLCLVNIQTDDDDDDGCGDFFAFVCARTRFMVNKIRIYIISKKKTWNLYAFG